MSPSPGISLGVVALILLNFLFIGVLPRIFFRQDGSFNLRWWLTAAPLFLSPLSVILVYLGVTQPSLTLAGPLAETTQIIAVILSAISVSLISFTLGTHRVPLALWHQENDAPKSIVTWGAYQRIRHPFYASFIITLVAAVVLAPHPGTLVSLLWGALILNQTAAREELRLSQSQFGSEYQSYMKKTGRFFPRLSSGNAT